MAVNPSLTDSAQIEMQRVEKSHEASYLENIQGQGYEHLGEPLQIEFNKSIEEIRNWILVQAQNLGANLVLEVENPPVSADQNGILVYYIWKSPAAQLPKAEPQAFACPYCTNPFMAVPGPESQVVACPNCGGANIVPAMEIPTQLQPQQQPQSQPEPQPQPQSNEVATSSSPASTAPASQPATPTPSAPQEPPAPQTLEPVSRDEVQTEQAPQLEPTPTAEPAPEASTTQAPTTPTEQVSTSESTATPASTSPATPAPTSPAPAAAPTEQTTSTAPEVYDTAEEYSAATQDYGQSTEHGYSEGAQDYSQSYNQQYSTEYPSFDYFSKKVETDTNKPKAPLLTPEYEQAYNTQFSSVEQAIKTNMEKLSELLANPRNTIKFYDSGELMYPKITIRKSAYLHLATREMDLLLIKDGVNDYKIIANESHGASGGNITPMQDELFAIKTLGHSSYRAMEDWAYLDNEQKVAVSKCIFAFTDIYIKKLPKIEEPVGKK
jgi:hypothetical protein